MQELKPFIDLGNDRQLIKNKVITKFAEIIDLLKLKEVVDEVHLAETPHRVAKMFMDELFAGCYEGPPNVKIFEDKNGTPVINSNITIKSVCAHHFIPFVGKCSIYYIPANNKLTGLSKFSRVADYYSRRPQIQENLTNQIGNHFVEALQPEELIVAIKAKHLCICHRGANEENPITETYFSYAKTGTIDFAKIQYVLETVKFNG